MTITRTVDGNELTFELTDHELCTAFFEQQRQFDEEDILWGIDGMDDEEIEDIYGVTRQQFMNALPDMACRYRKYLDNDDSWSDTRGYAIYDAIRDEYGV